jgi:hypothetical protein
MKKLFILASGLLLFTSLGFAQNFESPDIIVDTQLDSDWSGVLVSKIRRLLKNYGEKDPFTQKFDETVVLTEASIKDYLNPSAKHLVAELGTIIGLDLLDGKTQVSVKGLSYDVKGFKTDLKTTKDKQKGVSVSSDFSASRIVVTADKLTLSLVLPGKNKLPLLNIDIVRPTIQASGDKLIKIYGELNIEDKGSNFKLNLEKANFDKMSEALTQLQGEGISLDYETINVPEVSILAGTKTLSLDTKKIQQLLFSKKDAFKSLLVAQFAAMLKSGFAEKLLQVIDKVSFEKEYWVDTEEVFSGIRIDSFNGDSEGNHLEARLSGDFCTRETYQSFGNECVNNKLTRPRSSRLNQQLHDESIKNMRNIVDRGDANILLSVSEDYVNKILVSTIDAGLWSDMLDGAGVKLGPNKPFFRLDEKGSRFGTLYMDLLYTPKKLEQLAVGAKEVRFPLILKAGLKIKDQDGVPVIIIHIEDIDTSNDTLLLGRKDLGLISNIHNLRFKKKIISTMREETKSLANSDVLELPYPELMGLGLEKVDFISDGNGRMNALMLVTQKAKK